MYGISLEGGGGKGAYQVGAWKALKELNIDYGGVTGTSVGAINGAFMIQDDLEEAIEIWSDIAPSMLFDIDHSLQDRIKKLEKLPGHLSGLFRYMQYAVREKGLDITPMRKLLEKHIDEKKIRQSKKDYGLVTVSLTERTPMEMFIEDIPKDKLIEYIIASSSLPFFKDQEIEGKRFIDGGFYDLLPINMLIDKGYKDIIAISIKGMGIRRKVKNKEANITLIQPRESLGAILEFSPARSKTNIKLGFYDTLRAFNHYLGNKYYIDEVESEDYYFQKICRIDETEISPLLEKLKLPAGDAFRKSIFEKLIPYIAKALKLDKKASYRDIVLALLEHTAERQNIERFQVHSYHDFKNKVASAPVKELKKERKGVRLFKKSDLLPWHMREETITKFTRLLLSKEINGTKNSF